MRALLLTASATGLYYMPYDQITNMTLLVLAGLLAIPIAAYSLEHRLFARRAVIIQGCTEDGFAKRRLWSGWLLKITHYLVAIAIALLIIVVSSALDKNEWLIIMGSIAILILLESATLQFSQRHTTGVFLAIFQRGLIKWPVIIFVVIASSVLFIGKEYESYVNADVMILAKQSFEDNADRFNSSVLGYTHATLYSADKVTMYFAQTYIPRIDDIAVKWSLWSYLAIKSAASIGLIIYLFLGLLTLASIKERNGWKVLGKTVFEKHFTLTLLLLIGLYVYITSTPILLKDIIPEENVVDCSAAIAAYQKAGDDRRRQLGIEEKALSTEVEKAIDENVDKIFEEAGPGVEEFLNWHFSVLGEYQQLGTQLLPKLNTGASAMLKKNVVARINAHLEQFSGDIDTVILDQVNISARKAGKQLPRGDLSHTDCLPSLNLEPLVFEQNPIYVGHPQTMVAGGALVALIAKKTAAKVGAKGILKVTGKWVAATSTGLSATAVCAPIGFFAPLCGVGAAVVTWVAIDVAVVNADEIMNRDELRQVILDDLSIQKAAVKNQLISLNIGAIAMKYDIIESTFSIPKDGV